MDSCLHQAALATVCLLMRSHFVQNDLLILKVSSQLHHLSIKCAIHVLYVNKFNPNCLKRRPGDEVREELVKSQLHICVTGRESKVSVTDYGIKTIVLSTFSQLQMLTTPSEVVQWSNHRVMEWLRSVDLAEYAPNLRGSGVHGGLIVSNASL